MVLDFKLSIHNDSTWQNTKVALSCENNKIQECILQNDVNTIFLAILIIDGP